ncbi:hypothetical protein ACIQUQ_33005 [Streptomyces sp. NPDC101118]|uniref:hypothetical protein n=1 Tax=Streptomyces sp. NPDC101118 TaxID=3366109 RepID=UPI0038116869
MASSEEVAWQLYAGLEQRDRRAVDAWRSLGNDLVTSLMNSRALGSARPLRVPADDVVDWQRRQLGTDPDLVLARTAEHEAAHVVVAWALGLHVAKVSIGENGRDGVTTYEAAGRDETAAVAAAAEVWFTEFRALAYPRGDADGCRDDMRLLVRSTDGDHDIHRARRRARLILGERRDEVLALAARLGRERHITFEKGHTS